MIVLIGGEKGGTGKSTVAVNLACIAAKDGADLLVVDTDRQQSAAQFFGIRSEAGVQPYIACMQRRGKSLGKDLQSLAKKYELIIVDAGGQDSPELRYGLAVADEVYCPIQPNQFDLWTLDKMNELIDEARIFNDKLTGNTILNRCSANPRNTDAQEAREVLRAYENMFPLKTHLKERVAYQRVVRVGQSVVEYGKDDAAAKEINQLYKEIFYA